MALVASVTRLDKPGPDPHLKKANGCRSINDPSARRWTELVFYSGQSYHSRAPPSPCWTLPEAWQVKWSELAKKLSLDPSNAATVSGLEQEHASYLSVKLPPLEWFFDTADRATKMPPTLCRSIVRWCEWVRLAYFVEYYVTRTKVVVRSINSSQW